MIPTIFLVLLAFGLFYFYYGFVVLFMNFHSLRNRMFFSLSIHLGLWAVGEAFMGTAPDLETANFWRLVSAVGWCPFYSVWLDFAILVRHESKKWMTDIRRLFIYIPAVFLLIGNFNYDPNTVLKRVGFLWKDVYNPIDIFEIS